MENKKSFFIVQLKRDDQSINEETDVGMDLVLSSMNVGNILNKFYQKDGNFIYYCFQTETRKRRGQLIRLCEKFLPEEQLYKADGITNNQFYEELDDMKKKYRLVSESSRVSNYTGTDLKLFDNPNLWHSWQREIFGMVFTRNLKNETEYKKPDPRKIYSIIDETGNTGKSSFFKYIYYHNQDSVGRLTYGTVTQLRAAITNIGPKELYIIDLARTKAKTDSQSDLLSVIEEVKDGLVINARYSSRKTLVMEPPHIIVSSQYYMDYYRLSKDRWEIYKITKDKKLKKISTNQLRKLKNKSELIKK